MTHAKRERIEQPLFGFTNWGGKRKGAGRKPKGEKALVSHSKRAEHKARHPLQVTMKLAAGLPSLRRTRPFQVVRAALEVAADRFGCRVVHFAVLSNHLHLIVEADDNRALARGMNGLCVRIAHGLNRLWGRRGRVFADRFHVSVLENPTMVRNALGYVLHNAEKHGITCSRDGVDPFSSGASFDGWQKSLDRAKSSRSVFGRPRTWLLRDGWKRLGLLESRRRERAAR